MAETSSSGGRSRRGPQQGRRRQQRFGGNSSSRHRRRVCTFCVDKIKYIDYKDSNMLGRFITERGQIRSRRKSGMCAKHQRRLARAIKRARFMALLPYTSEHIRQSA